MSRLAPSRIQTIRATGTNAYLTHDARESPYQTVEGTAKLLAPDPKAALPVPLFAGANNPESSPNRTVEFSVTWIPSPSLLLIALLEISAFAPIITRIP